MLFSDWDGSGRRDLRVSNDRHYYDDEVGGEQLWRFEPGVPPRAYTAADGWGLVRLWGMGIASYDVTGDGYPEVYLTSQGANTPPDPRRGAVRSPPTMTSALKRGVDATRPVVGGDPLPSTAWHPEFEDVNNDGFMDLFVTKGNVNEHPDYAQKDPNNLFLGQPDGTFVEGAEAAGIVDVRPRPRRRPGRLQQRRPARPRRWSNLGRPPACGATSGAARPMRPAPMGGWLGVRLHQPGANRDAIGAGRRDADRRHGRAARARRSAAATPAASSAGRTSGSGRPTERGRARDVAGRRGRPVA